RPQLLQDAAKVLLRLAVAIQHRRIEIVHADRDRTRDEPFLVGGIAAHHDAAHRATPKAQRRDFRSGTAEVPHLHLQILARFVGWISRRRNPPPSQTADYALRLIRPTKLSHLHLDNTD